MLLVVGMHSNTIAKPYGEVEARLVPAFHNHAVSSVHQLADDRRPDIL